MYGDKSHGMDIVLSNGFSILNKDEKSLFSETTLLSLENLLIMAYTFLYKHK